MTKKRKDKFTRKEVEGESRKMSLIEKWKKIHDKDEYVSIPEGLWDDLRKAIDEQLRDLYGIRNKKQIHWNGELALENTINRFEKLKQKIFEEKVKTGK